MFSIVKNQMVRATKEEEDKEESSFVVAVYLFTT